MPKLTKLTVNLVPRAVAALDHAVDTTSDSKVDTINRSIQFYDFIVSLLDDGKLLFVEDPKNGSRERIILL